MATINDLPVELLIYITKFCDKKSIIALNKVNKIWYQVTKDMRENIRYPILTYTECNTYMKLEHIYRYITFDYIPALKTLLELSIIHSNQIICDDDITHKTVIDYAVKFNKITVLKLLLKYGCDLNNSNSVGLTPLMVKAGDINDERDIYTFTFLLNHGADPNIEDWRGYIAMDFLSNNYTDTAVNILRNFGSREGNTYKIFDYNINNYEYIDYDYDSGDSQFEMDYGSTDEEINVEY